MYSFIKENRIKVLLIPLILYWIILFIGTTLPSDHLSSVVELSDKLKHFIAYFGLSFLLGLNLHFQEKWKGAASHYLIYALVIGLLYGVIDEIHQIFVPNRSAEFYDWLADAAGTLTGVLISYLFIKKLNTDQSLAET